MKDLTPLQAAKALRKLFPTRTCNAAYQCYSYSHIPPGKESTEKVIYISDLSSKCHFTGTSFRTLISQVEGLS